MGFIPLTRLFATISQVGGIFVFKGVYMAENKVKDGNYIMIQSFMVKDLKLKGNELLVYAIIYGFSQEENCVFSGSLQYLSDWTNSTKQGIMKCLKSLEEKGLIVKQSLMVNKVVYSTKFNTNSKQSLMDSVKQSLSNNIDKDNIINNKEKKIDAFIGLFGFSSASITSIKEWLQYKKEKNQTYKDKGLETLCKRLYQMQKENGEQYLINAINHSMANNYAGVYPENKSKPKDNGKQATKRDYTQHELDSLYDDIESIEI